jgi:antirestriction protein ArdC
MKNTTNSATPEKRDVYAIVTDRIIAQLEQGVIPWEKPWTGTGDGAISHGTGAPYSFLNQMLLGRPGEYVTFNQIVAEGGHIRKGEKPGVVVFYKPIARKTGNTITDDDGNEIDETRPGCCLRYYHVWHIDQVEGITAKYAQPATPAAPTFETVEEAERIARNYLTAQRIRLDHTRGDQAYYAPGRDVICLPLREQFRTASGYYGALFHEATHSTGHSSRLDRLRRNAHFGNGEYSKEELVAELGSAYLLHHTGLDTAAETRNNAAYIQSWLRALKNDRKMLVWAAGKAEKAARFILEQPEAATTQAPEPIPQPEPNEPTAARPARTKEEIAAANKASIAAFNQMMRQRRAARQAATQAGETSAA